MVKARRIVYFQYTDPAYYPSLEHSSQILAKNGWQILFLGTGSFGKEIFKFLDHSNIKVKKLRFCKSGWFQKFHYLGFCLWVIGWIIYWRPQWIYASDPLSCPLALILSYVFVSKMIYHEHDSPPVIPKSVWTHFSLWARRRLALRAKLNILPNERRARQFRKETHTQKDVFWVWNCPLKEEACPQRLPHTDGNLRVLYHGSLVPARLPVMVLEALTVLPDKVKLSIVGYKTIGYPFYAKELQEKAVRLGIEPRVEFVGTFPERADLLQFCSQCDVGLALMPKNSSDWNEQAMEGASNKPFDYLARGLVLLVSDLAEWKELFVRPGYGLSCDPADSQSIALALGWFLEHPQERRIMGERGEQKIASNWNYETQFQPVLNLLNGIQE